MHFPRYALFLGFSASVAFGGSLRIINNNEQCMVWSEDNFGCTGYSSPFARLDGKDCSGRSHALGFATSRTNRGPDFTVSGEGLKLNICGTEDGQQVAWVDVNKKGTVSFLNQQGNTFSCALDNDFKVDSKCSAASVSTTYATSLSSTSTPITSQSRPSTSASSLSSTPTSTPMGAYSCVLVPV